jgi:poly(A) polymerase
MGTISTPVHTPGEVKAFATAVVKRLADAGYRAVFAGGCVRDMLLGVPPQDYDVATSATPEQIMALFPRNVPVGAAFGVICVLGEGEDPIQVEVATFRGETSYSDGRHPDEVRFTDEVEDVKRRDFTVNGLLFDPLKNEVLDYVRGRRDLEQRVIRAIGDPARRFQEDHLRMLRAVRFASTLCFEIDGLTLSAIKDSAAQIVPSSWQEGGKGGVSAERIRDELSSMLSGPDPRRACELLKKTRLLKHILPEVDAMEGVPQPKEFHPEGDVWTHTMLMLDLLANAADHPSPTPPHSSPVTRHPSPLTLAWAVLLHDVGKPPTIEHADRIRFNEHERVGAELAEKIMARLKYSNEETDRVVELVRQHMVFKDADKMRPATLKRFLRQPHFSEHLELNRLDCLSSHGCLDAYEFCAAQLRKQSAETLRPPPLLTGKDLIALGLKPGPQFKAILSDVEDKQLEGTLKNHDEALRYVREMLANRH